MYAYIQTFEAVENLPIQSQHFNLGVNQRAQGSKLQQHMTQKARHAVCQYWCIMTSSLNLY